MSLIPLQTWAEALQISGGLDTRFINETNPADDDFVLEGLFLNLRKIWSDDSGDRLIGVAQVDVDHNFDDVSPYQLYLQYKGPLGKWNVRAGHFLLPFGLLATFDTERLLLRGLEETNLGIRKDTGVQLLGFAGQWDYAISLTDGLGDRHLLDSRAAPVLTARVAYVEDEWQIGFSTLLGRVLPDPDFELGSDTIQERRAALDYTLFRGPLTVRTELVGGEDDDKTIAGGILLADYALTSRLEINSRYALWHSDETSQFAGIGLSYQIRPWLWFRLADEYEFGDDYRNVFTAQLYMEFSRAL